MSPLTLQRELALKIPIAPHFLNVAMHIYNPAVWISAIMIDILVKCKKKSSDIRVCSTRGFPSILSSIYRLCTNISAILVYFFLFFLHPTIVCRYHVEMARHPKCQRYIMTFPTLVITNNKIELPFIISFF